MSNGSSAHSRTSGSAADCRWRFQEFFEGWLPEQNCLLQLLVSASRDYENNYYNNDEEEEENSEKTTMGEPTRQEEAENERVLIPLISQVVQQYESFYAAKSDLAAGDVLATLSPMWTNSLEDAFLWIGGWRPCVVFHLLFSKLGLQVESRLEDLSRGLRTCDLAGISPDQLTRIDHLQRTTLRKERDITEKMAKQQETVADAAMVELSHQVSESLRTTRVMRVEEGRVDSALETMGEGFVKIMDMADGLRMGTMRSLLDMLTPIQAVHFLITATELRLRVRDWGSIRTVDHDYHHRGQSRS